MSEKVIEVEKLTKKYGKLTAVNAISFDVKKGEVFGLLGENGAGKTTTLEIIEGLRHATSGKIRVLHYQVKDGAVKDIKERIGVQLQSSAYFKFLTLTEILNLFGSFYSKQLPAEELLEMVNLQDKAKTYVNNLSGGQKQRFSIIASLINDPEIIFLDEPTTGLDPLARRHLWDIIAQIKKRGKTIILTTHYMEEAEILCDRIAIMEKGKIVAMGETHELIDHVKYPYKIKFLVDKINQTIFDKLSKLGHLTNLISKANQFELKLTSRADLNQAIGYIHELQPADLIVGRATLEDLFIELTGKTIGDEENE